MFNKGKKRCILGSPFMCCPVGQGEGVYRFDSGVAGWDEMGGQKLSYERRGYWGHLSSCEFAEVSGAEVVFIRCLRRRCSVR